MSTNDPVRTQYSIEKLRAHLVEAFEGDVCIIGNTTQSEIVAAIDAAQAELAKVRQERDAALGAPNGLHHGGVLWAVTERITAEAIASFLDQRAADYTAKRDRLTRLGKSSEDESDEYGWAVSYTEGHAADIRSGAWRKERP